MLYKWRLSYVSILPSGNTQIARLYIFPASSIIRLPTTAAVLSEAICCIHFTDAPSIASFNVSGCMEKPVVNISGRMITSVCLMFSSIPEYFSRFALAFSQMISGCIMVIFRFSILFLADFISHSNVVRRNLNWKRYV